MATKTAKNPREAKFVQGVFDDFKLCMPPVVRVSLEVKEKGGGNMKVAMSSFDSQDDIFNFFYLKSDLDIAEGSPSTFFLSGQEFGQALSENKTGTFDVKTSKSKFILEGKEIPTLPVGTDCPDPEGSVILFDLRIVRTVALRLNAVMEAASQFFPDSQWVTLSLVEGGIELIFSSPNAAMVAKVATNKGVDTTNTMVNSVSFPKIYWERVSSLLKKDSSIQAYYIQSSSEDYLVIGAHTNKARFVGLLPLDAPAKIHDESPSVNLDWYDDPGQVTVSLEDKGAIASFVQAVNSAPGESVDLIPGKTGLQVLGTDYVLPVPDFSGLEEKITVPKAYLMGALMSSSLVTALILGVHLPLTLQLAKGAVSVFLALKTLFSPVEQEKPLQEVAKKAKKKKTSTQTGNVTVTPLPEETVAIAEVIAENAGADDPKLKEMIKKVKAEVPVKETSEIKARKPLMEGPVEEIYLGVKALGRYLTLTFDLRGLKLQVSLADIQMSESPIAEDSN
jgi:hypothetical protein